MSEHIKNLNKAKAAIKKAEEQLKDLKQKANTAAAELQELESKAEATEQEYQAALERLAQNALTDEQADSAEHKRDQAAAELGKRRPRLLAAIKAGEVVNAGPVIDELLAAELAARVAVTEYWQERRPEIEAEARKGLKAIKLWMEFAAVNIETELRFTEIEPQQMPLNDNYLKSSYLKYSDRAQIKQGRRGT